MALEQTCQLPGYAFVTAQSTTHFNLPALSIGLDLSHIQETLYVVWTEHPSRLQGRWHLRIQNVDWFLPGSTPPSCNSACLCRNRSPSTWLTAFLTATLSNEKPSQQTRLRRELESKQCQDLSEGIHRLNQILKPICPHGSAKPGEAKRPRYCWPALKSLGSLDNMKRNQTPLPICVHGLDSQKRLPTSVREEARTYPRWHLNPSFKAEHTWKEQGSGWEVWHYLCKNRRWEEGGICICWWHLCKGTLLAALPLGRGNELWEKRWKMLPFVACEFLNVWMYNLSKNKWKLKTKTECCNHSVIKKCCVNLCVPKNILVEYTAFSNGSLLGIRSRGSKEMVMFYFT